MADQRGAKGLAWWMPVALVGAVVAVYANSLRAPFFQDDFQIIVHNERLHRLWPPTLKFWSDPNSGTWGRPVAALVYALNYAVCGGEDPTGYHVVNLALHAGCALLLMGVVRRTLRLPRFAERWSERAASWVAFTIALLWAVHPLNTDAVTYLAARGELLFSLCLLAMMYSFLRGWRMAAVVACALGMGCKEVMVVAPIVMLLFDGLFVEPSPGVAVRKRWGFYLALACTWLLLAAILLRPELSTREQLSGSCWLYLKTQAGVIVHYFRLVFWPKPLVIDYFGWPVAERLGDVLPQALLLLLLLGLSVWALVRRHWLGFVGAWVFLALGPTSSIYPIWIEVATERRMYLPLMGFVAALVICIAEPARRRGRGVMVASSIFAVIVVLVWAILTIQRNGDYRDLVTLTRTTVDARPDNSRAWIAHGSALVEKGDDESALGAYEMAVRTGPRSPYAYLARGGMLAHLHRYDLAEADFKAAGQLDSSMPEPHLELGKLYLVENQLPVAEAEFRRAIELYPYWIDPHTWLAGLLIQERRLDEAEALLVQTAREHPGAHGISEALERIRLARRAGAAVSQPSLQPQPMPPR
jgi:tetratricopeptide (TPR) repeat protein